MKWRFLVVLSIGVLVVGCNQAELTNMKDANEKLEAENQSLKSTQTKMQNQMDRMGEIDRRMNFWVSQMQNVKARIETNMGNMEVKLYPGKAPIHCFAFIARAEGGFYDNTQFHRVIPGFMIQGGDPNSKNKDPYDDGSGGPLVNIPHEFNDTKHMKGILSMARVGDVNAGAGCQFFIMHGPTPHLDGQYTAFGEVTSGLDVLDKIANVKVIENNPRLQNHPVNPVIIKHIEVFR